MTIRKFAIRAHKALIVLAAVVLIIGPSIAAAIAYFLGLDSRGAGILAGPGTIIGLIVLMMYRDSIVTIWEDLNDLSDEEERYLAIIGKLKEGYVNNKKSVDKREGMMVIPQDETED